jgi:hypothetical protein
MGSLVWFPVPEDCDDFLFFSFESARLRQSHRPWYAILILSQWPVAQLFRDKLMCLQSRLWSLPLHGFRIGAYGSGALFSRRDLEPEMKGI